MKKILIYGAGVGGKRLLEEMKQNTEPYEMVAFVDQHLGGTVTDGIPVIAPEDISNCEYDFIFIATLDQSIPEMLRERFHVPAEKINKQRYWNSTEIHVRIRALERFKELCDLYEMKGSVAEVGVYQGDFAKHINRLFPESKLYLYDTFEGFSLQDIEKEENQSHVKTYCHYSNTNVDLVLNKLPYPKQAVVRKGLFPETAVSEPDQYVFVSLDADLYAPTLAGLEYFWEQMVCGGTIFVHDYFSPEFTGVRKAVSEFLSYTELGISPLGDFQTISITKPFSRKKG